MHSKLLFLNIWLWIFSQGEESVPNAQHLVLTLEQTNKLFLKTAGCSITNFTHETWQFCQSYQWRHPSLAKTNVGLGWSICINLIFSILTLPLNKHSLLFSRVYYMYIEHSGLELWFREKKSSWHMTFTQSWYHI